MKRERCAVLSMPPPPSSSRPSSESSPSMSTATVTYHELPPLSAWASAAAYDHQPFLDPNALLESPAPWIPISHDGSLPVEQNGAVNCMVEGQVSPAHLWPPPGSGHHGQPQDGVPAPSLYGFATSSPLYPVTSTPSDFRGGKKRLGGVRNSVPSGGPVSGNGAPEELCLVCGDKASGYHYNALTCEGCKGFFRRSITRKAVYYCKYGDNCDIDMYMRRKCQRCRLRKCMHIGMRPERLRAESRMNLVVVPEETCRVKREAKMKMRSLSAATEERKNSSSPPQVTSTETSIDHFGLTPEQRELVHRLVLYQQQYDMPSDDAVSKLSTFSKDSSHHTQPFQHLVELTILTVQLILEFTEHLPGFSTLTKGDQLTLRKACSTEVLMLRTARRYDSKTDTIVLGNQSTSWAYSREAYKQAGIGFATDAIFDFAKSMTKMRVDNAEYALLTAVAVFSDRPGLAEPKKVEELQEVYTNTLQAYIDVHRPKHRSVFAKLLMKLTDLRTLGSEHADMLCALKFDTNLEPKSPEQSQSRSASRRSSFDGRGEAEAFTPSSQQNRLPNVQIKVEPLSSESQAAQFPPALYSTADAATPTDRTKARLGVGDLLEQAVISSFAEFPSPGAQTNSER